jgi:hypothetical protein
MPDELVNVTSLARLLRLPGGWLRGEALAGRIPCLKVGRKLRFNPAAVQAALARRAAESAAAAPSAPTSEWS